MYVLFEETLYGTGMCLRGMFKKIFRMVIPQQ